VLESFFQEEMKKLVRASFHKEEPDDTVSIKSLTHSLRERLSVFGEINNLLFKP